MWWDFRGETRNLENAQDFLKVLAGIGAFFLAVRLRVLQWLKFRRDHRDRVLSGIQGVQAALDAHAKQDIETMTDMGKDLRAAVAELGRDVRESIRLGERRVESLREDLGSRILRLERAAHERNEP